MPTKGELDIERTVSDLRDAGFTVVQVGKRYRVTNPEGGDPAFMPMVLPKNGRATSIKDVERVLKSIGYDPAQAEEARERLRRKRLADDQSAGAAALERAQALADAAPAPAEVQRIVRQRIADNAPVVSAGPRTEIIEMDADFAAELLRHNQFYRGDGSIDGEAGERRTNRPFSTTRADRYRDAILAGEWRLTHQGVALDTNGTLMDGQHRLVGLVLAAEQKPGVTIETMVTYDLEPEVFDAIDTGGKRSVADVLAAYGEKGGGQAAAVVRLIIFYDSGNGTLSEWKRTSVSAERTREMLNAHPGIREAARWGSNKPLALPSSEGAARYLIMREAGGELGQRFAREFFEAYRTGVGLNEQGMPLLVLRETLFRQSRNSRRVRHPVEHLAYIIKAWNAEVAGKRMKQISWKDVEALPRVTRLS